MEKTETNARIYVACLASYNNGILYGKWINACQTVEELQDDVAEILKGSPIEDSEEWAIHDYEGFEGLRISEYEGLESVSNLAHFIQEHGKLGAGVYNHCSDLEEAQTALEEQYIGEYESVSDFAREFTEDNIPIPNELQYYIDYDAMARDMEATDVFTVETAFQEVHIFWHH